MSDSPRIAIIGMGFLMSYLKPCYHNAIGKDLSKNIIASTATASTIEKKSKAMGFPVQCQNYYEMLNSFRPDIIFFAPPPSAAKAMARNILTPFYAMLRDAKKPLPDLYAYPPNPNGRFYLDTIGEDINVVNILPNMAAKLKERNISKESYTIFNFPDNKPWPKDNYNRLVDFFKPIGYTISVPASKFNTMLGGFVASHITEEIAISASKGLEKAKVNISFSEIASSMRYFFLKNVNHHIDGSLTSYPLKNEKLNSVFEKMIIEWMGGMLDYYAKNNLDEALGKEILIPQIDIFLQSAQLLTVDEINYNNSCHATKGGILEKALTVFHREIEEKVIEIFSNYNNENFDIDLYGFIRKEGYIVSKEVSEHGAKFAD